ncbi:S1 RNA binding domain protein, partial [Chlamydia psittaci 84-8471/1]
GIVKNITDFGVFLDLDGIDGLLHITDMTWKRIRHPSEMVELNQELEVVILSVDKEKGRVALGLKQKEHNPWEDIEKKYPPGKR